jgi:hypothetical protein
MIYPFRITIAAAALSFLLPSLRAEDTPFTLPAGEPLAMMSLPDGLVASNVSVAISKALVEEEWENLGWEGNVTTATMRKSRVNIKVFALAGVTDVKLYAQYSSESNVPEDKCRQTAQRELKSLEKTIAGKLNLSFHKAKGDETADRATGG